MYDENGNERGSIFYKGIFYDRNGHMNLNTRFRISTEYAPGQEEVDEDAREEVVFLRDADGSKAKVFGQARRYGERFRTMPEFKKLQKQAELYMQENYPNWDDPTKYWDWLAVETALKKEIELQMANKEMRPFTSTARMPATKMTEILNKYGWKKINMKHSKKKKIQKVLDIFGDKAEVFYNPLNKRKLAIFGDLAGDGLMVLIVV